MKSTRNLLLDANSFLLLIRSDEHARTVKSPIIGNSKILDLTVYEIGNALWKELELLKSLKMEDAERLANAVNLVMTNMEKLFVGASEFSDVMSIARAEKKTFYDSSYIYIAKREKMMLVTEDRGLSKVAQKYIGTVSVRELIDSHVA